MAKPNPNLLLVEGKDEQFTLPRLLDHYVVWGDKEEEWIVKIKEFDGIENLLKPGVIEVELKTPDLKAVGLIVDADHSLDSHWRRVRDRCRKVAADFPEELTPGGVVHVMSTGLRIGIWLMPECH